MRRTFATILAVATPSAASIPFAALTGVPPAVDAPDHMAAACQSLGGEFVGPRPDICSLHDSTARRSPWKPWPSSSGGSLPLLAVGYVLWLLTRLAQTVERIEYRPTQLVEREGSRADSG